jgi:ribose transport system ATP-binding protein
VSSTGSVEANPRTALAVRGLAKRFGATQALDNADFEVRWGEIHALVGGNGSGKSTLIKTLAGVHSADAGELEVGGATIDLTHYTPRTAAALGLRFVHQDLGIFSILSVADNLAIGHRFNTTRAGRIRKRASRRDSLAILERFHLDVDPGISAGELAAPQRVLLAIARALHDVEGRRAVLFLDEPTAALPLTEAKLLLSNITRLAEAGHAIVLVTHRLDEVHEVAHRATGLRDGRSAGTINAVDLTEQGLVELILGARLPHAAASAEAQDGVPVLEAQGLVGGPIRGIDLEVRAGEILGIAGLLGSGRTELLELLYGARRIESGELRINGQQVRRPSTPRMAAAGMAFVPEDRLTGGIFQGQSVSQNITVGSLSKYFRNLRFQYGKMRSDVARDVTAYQIKVDRPSAAIETLSGGNQQKVVLARWLRQRPALIVLDEPTQGLDIGARATILSLVVEAAEQGAAVIMVSSELEELARLCHRVVVLARGQIVEEHSSGLTAHEMLESVISNTRSIYA